MITVYREQDVQLEWIESVLNYSYISMILNLTSYFKVELKNLTFFKDSFVGE